MNRNTIKLIESLLQLRPVNAKLLTDRFDHNTPLDIGFNKLPDFLQRGYILAPGDHK
jgi:hypothetical protein